MTFTLVVKKILGIEILSLMVVSGPSTRSDTKRWPRNAEARKERFRKELSPSETDSYWCPLDKLVLKTNRSNYEFQGNLRIGCQGKPSLRAMSIKLRMATR